MATPATRACSHRRARDILFSTTSLTALLIGTMSGSAIAGEKLWYPSVGATLTHSDIDTIGSLELFAPVAQGDSSVFFVDLRLDPANLGDFRGSYGAGIRHIVNPDLMIGAYGFYNNEVFDGTPFRGVTVGAEFLTPDWDGHLNYHHSLSSAVAIGGASGTTLSLVGNDLIALINTRRRVPLDGVEAEIGYTVRDVIAEGNSVRLSGGAYHYFDKDTDFSFTGVKAGLEYEHKFTDSPYSPRLTLGGNISHDNANGTGYQIEARLRIPLGGAMAAIEPDEPPTSASTTSGPNGSGLGGGGLTRDRLNERIRVTGIIATDVGDTQAATVTDPNTGNAIGRFFFADDANSAGTGTFDDPTTLDDAIANAGNYGFVVGLENGLPADINTAGSTLLTGQSLLGGGTSVPVLVNGTSMTFTLPGTAGTINGTSGNAVITLADDNIVRNLAFTGGGYGISGDGIADGTIDDVTFRTTGDTAIRLTNTTGTQTISNFLIDGTGDDGIFVEGVAKVNVSSGSIDNTADQGIDIRDSNVDIESVSIGTANASSIGTQGIIINNGANVRTVNVTNVTIGSATAGVTDHVGAEALSAASAGTGKLSLNLTGNNILRSSGTALSTLSGGPADNLEIAFGNLNAEAGTLVPAIDIQGSKINATTMSTVVRSAGTITVDGNGTGGGIRFNAVRFDADAGTVGDQLVAFGAMTIGSSVNRVQGDGLSFLAPTGDVQLASLNIFNNLGTGLEVDTKIGGTSFNLDTLGGSVDTTNGTALFLDPLTGNINFSTVSSTNATNLGATSQISSGNGTGVTVDGLTSGNSNPALTIGTLTVTNPGTSGILINDSADIAFGASTITLATANTQGIDFQSTSGNVSFGTTTITGVGSASGQTGVDFNGATLGGMVDFASNAISGPPTSTDSIGVDLTGVQGNQSVNLGSQANPSGGPSSSISGLHRGVVINATGSVQFTFGDGEAGSDTGSSIDVNGQSGAFTVDAGGGTLPSSTYDFADVTFGSGDSAKFPAAPSSVIFVSTLGGNVAAGTNGLSEDVTTITVAAAEALSDDDQTFVFVGDSSGIIDVAGGGSDGFTLLDGQSIDSFNDGNAITIGSIQPGNITGNFGVIGSTITANDVTATHGGGAGNVVVTSSGGGMIENFDIVTTGVGISITGASSATTVSNVAIDGQGGTGTGLLINSNAAAITVNDVDITSTGAGLRAINGTSAGSVTVDAASSIGATSVNALTVENWAGDFTMNGSISETDGTGSGVAIGTATGTIAFNGSLTLNTGASDGIRIGNSANTTITFDTGLIDIDTTNGSGLNIFNNTGTTISFLNGFDIDTGTGTGITATGSQTIRTVDPTSAVADVTSASGTAINLNGTTIAAGGMQFSNISAGGATNGIVINNVSGGTFSVSAGGTVNVSGSSGDGILIENSSADFDFGSSSSAVTTTVTSAGGNGVTLDTNTGAIDFGSLTITGAASSGLAVTDNTGAITIADATVDGSTQWGVRLANNSGTFDIEDGTIGATTSNTVGFQVNGGSGDVSLGADITQTATGGGAVQVNGRSTGTVRVYGDITANTGGSDAIQVFSSTGGTITFDTGVLDLDTTNGTAIHLLNNAGAAINFLNGFDIDTTTGAGFRATGGGTIRTVDPAGAVAADVTTAGGMAIDLNAITVDANGMAFSTVTTTGGSTAIGINNVSGGAIAFDTVSITNPSTTGIDISNAIGSAVSFGDIDIALGSDNTTAFDLSSATIGANLTADDFDVTSSSATGTTGIDLSGTTGTGTIRLGNTDASGADATIAGVAQGVLFSAATDTDFIFGDGEQSTDIGSSISATTALAGTLPSSGNYNFFDVDFPMGTGLSGEPSIYYATDVAIGSGDGSSFANAGNMLGAFNATADAIVIFDHTDDDTQDVINLAAIVGTFVLDDGQVLVSVSEGETVDLSTYGIAVGSAPSNFQFSTTVLAGLTGVVTAPTTGVDSVRPLLSNNANVIQVSGGGAIVNVEAETTGIGAAITGSGSISGNLILSGVTTRSAGDATINLQSNGGLSLSGSGNLIEAVTGSAAGGLILNDVLIGAAGLNFANVATFNSSGSFSPISVNLVGGSGTLSFDTVNLVSSLTRDALRINNTTADVTISGGTISHAGSGTGTSAFIYSGDGDITIGADIDSSDFGGLAVVVSNRTGGTVTISGTLTDNASTGGEIALANNDGSVNFTGTGNIIGTNRDAVTISGTGTADYAFNDFTIVSTAGTGFVLGGNQTGTLALDTITVAGSAKAIDIAPTGAGLTITDFADISVPGGSGGVTISNVTFDADADTVAIEAVNGGNLAIGTSAGNRVTGDGLRLDGVLGRIDFGTLDIYNDSGTGLYVRDGAGKGGTFTLTNTGGTIDTTNGTAIDIDPVSTDLTFATVSSTNAGAAGGLLIDTVTGIGGSANALTITNLSVTGSGANGVTVRNSSGNYTFTNTTISGATGNSVSVFGGSSVLNFSGGTLTHDVGNAAAAVSVAGGHTGSLTFSGGINATTGTGLQFDNADGTSYSFNGAVTLNGGDAGVDIVNGSDAAFTFSNLAITNPTGTAFNIDGSNIAALTFGGSITQNNTASAFVSNASTGGIHNIGASITANTGTADAVAISSTGTFNFSGGLGIDTTSGSGFTATGGGTVTVQGLGNTVTTSTGTAVTIDNTTIGAAGVTFRSVSANGAVNGIVLNNTGASGGFTITGDGTNAANGSGGTIQNTSSDGISLTSTRDVSIRQLNITDAATGDDGTIGDDHGIDIASVTNFSYSYGVMNGFGAAASSYDDQNSINILNLYGTSTIDNVTFTEMNENGIAYRNTLADDGTRDVLTVSNSTFSNHLATTHGEDGIDYQADGTALAGLIVSGSTFTIDGDGALGIQFSSQGTANADLTVQGSNFNAASAFGAGTILTNNTANSTSVISITGNTITNTPFTGIDVLNNDTAVTRATISNNIVDGNGVGINNGFGIRAQQDEDGTMFVLIDNNTIGDFTSAHIRVIARDELIGSGTLNATITNNTSANATDAFEFGLQVLAQDTNTLCANISGNDFTGGASVDDIRLLAQAGATLNITQSSASNVSANGDTVDEVGTINYNQGACPTP